MKRIVALLLALIMCFSLASCAKGTGEKKEEAQDANTITVVDMEGVEVKIPADTKNNTVATNYGVLTPFFVTLQMSDQVLATTIKNKGFMRKVDESILKTGDIGSYEIDAEALATLSPSILVTRASDSGKRLAGESLGIPTIGFYIESNEEVIKAYELLGKCFGCEERANELISYIDGEIENIEKLASTIPDEEKVTAICLGTVMGQVASGDMLQSAMIEFAGGKCLVEEAPDNEKWFEAGTEKIFAYNPDFIFATSSSPLEYKLSSLYEENAWSGMKAIQDGNLYQIPAKIDSWDMPGPAFVLGTYFMMHCMYPELVSSDMMQEKIDEFYTLFYGTTFDGETLGYTID